MNLIEKATVMHFHRNRIAHWQAGSVESLGWRTEQSQLARFDALLAIGDVNGCTVLDVGCGHGDLKSFLDGRFSAFHYLGIDQMPEFVDIARQRYADHAATEFYQADFATADLPPTDYIFASGVFGYRSSDPQFYSEAIRKLFSIARRGLAFNMLDIEHFPEHPLLVGHDRKKILSFCRDLTPDTVLTDGYLPDDFTILMRHGAG